MDLYDILAHETVALDLKLADKDAALRQIAEVASAGREGLDAQTVYEALATREAQGSTGFGNEVAVPHARIPGLEHFIVGLLVVPRGVEFAALDKKKVKLVFFILGPAEAVNEHLKILAFLSRALGHTNLKQELLAARSREAAVEAILRNTGSARTEQKAEARKQKLVFINLYDEDDIYGVLEVLIENGIEGATVFESSGMGRYISNVPLFADFIGFLRENKHSSKTIMTVVPEDLIEPLLSGIEDVTGNMDTTQGAMFLVMDVSFAKGSMGIV